MSPGWTWKVTVCPGDRVALPSVRDTIWSPPSASRTCSRASAPSSSISITSPVSSSEPSVWCRCRCSGRMPRTSSLRPACPAAAPGSAIFTSDARLSTYANPALDKLIVDARYETDPKKRQAVYDKALTIIHDEAPWLFMFQYEDLYATTKRLAWEARGDETIFCDEMKLK